MELVNRISISPPEYHLFCLFCISHPSMHHGYLVGIGETRLKLESSPAIFLAGPPSARDYPATLSRQKPFRNMHTETH